MKRRDFALTAAAAATLAALPAAFAQALLELARDPARRSRMGQNGQARVAREHSWDAVAQQILALADA